MERDVDRFLEKYVLRTEANFSIYYYEDIFDVVSSKLPDIMVFDHRHLKDEGQMEKVLALTCAHALITNGTLKEHIRPEDHPFDVVVNAPLSWDKTLRILDQRAGHTDQAAGGMPEQKVHFENLQALVAEDNLVNQKLIKAVLEKYGIGVTLTSNGEEALNMRKQNDYDLIFMDIQMPVMNGVEATQKILSYERAAKAKHIPVIALTANALAGDAQKYIKEGMDNYLAKPIDVERLLELVRYYFPHHVVSAPIRSRPSESVPKKLSTPIEAEKKPVVEGITGGSDILLYMPMPLLLKVYRHRLTMLGYSLDETLDKDIFFEKIANNQYTHVIYDGDDFDTQKYEIAEKIAASGSSPLMVASHSTENIPLHLKWLRFDSSLDEIRETLIMNQCA
jgi:CheY-like chemotaxis protein